MSTLSTNGPPPPSDIMIVDDNPANLKLLEDMLVRQGHEVRSFPLGRMALQAAAGQPPDLILLDINMPQMSGYEVCEKLKASADLRDIPVIFLSALHELQDKVKAFRAGGVDYISKPFQFEEVHARVQTHVQLHHLQRALRRHNEMLEETVAARTLQLAAAHERLTLLDRSKSDFLQLISHEFRTPLNGILGVASLLLESAPPSERKDKLQPLYERARRRILAMIDDALLLTKIDGAVEQWSAVSFPLSAAIQLAMGSARDFAQSREVKLIAPADDSGTVAGNQALLVRALQALLETAVKFAERGEAVRLSMERAARTAGPTLTIESHGRTIPQGALPKFFELFSIGESITPGGDLGVGPPLAKRVLALFGGSVSVVNLDDSPPGIRFTVSLKDAVPQAGEVRAMAM